MKIEIDVKMGTAHKGKSSSKIDLLVKETETVASLKERVAAAQLIPFPEQDLMLNGKVLTDGQTLADCGVKEQSSLDLIVQASEAALVKQMSQLLEVRDLSCDELGLLYCYKHGVSATQALRIIGQDTTLQDFLKSQKCFKVVNNNVAMVREDTKLKPFSVLDEVQSILEANGGSLDIKELSSKFVQKFNVSLASIGGAKPLEILGREPDRFTISAGRVSLKAAAENASVADAKTPSRLEAVDLPPGLEAATPVKSKEVEQAPCDSQQYLDLHNKICGRGFNSKVAQALSEVVDMVLETTFLDVDHVVKGGSVGKGTSISGISDADIVLFLKGMPLAGHDKWLPPLVKATATTLSQNTGGASQKFPCIESISAAEDSVSLRVKGLLNVSLRFSPVMPTYTQTIQVLAEQRPEARRYYSPSLVEQRVQFIARQPGQVKITIRLLKWWRDQQEWSSKTCRPTDDIIELMTVYSAVQTKPTDQRKAIANIMSLLARFDELRIVWSNFYSKADVWAPLLRQKPLLMDPVNPFLNLADPKAFDARELMDKARTTHFFW